MNLNTLLFFIASIILTASLVIFLIPILKRLKFGQSIREVGPNSHFAKQGVPTMGGISFLISISLVSIIYCILYNNFQILSLVIAFLLFGLIGFIDDYIIVVKKDNQGLTAKQKLILQVIFSVTFYLILRTIFNFQFDYKLHIPFTDLNIYIGYFYVLFIVFWMVGFSNAVNLIDGVDGLSTSVTIIALFFIGIISLNQKEHFILDFIIIVIGALIGFFIFNKYKAKIIMGDTGSLALGGLLASLSIILNEELLLIVIGIMFVIVTLSVIIQVNYFKLTGKRIFKMTPLHHHFEILGWSEWKIVIAFSIVGIIGGLISLLN